MKNYLIQPLRFSSFLSGSLPPSLALAAVALFSSSSLQAQTDSAEQHYQRYVELYQQAKPSQEDLSAGRDQLARAYQLAPDTLRYSHQLGLASSIIKRWDEAVHWLDRSLNLATEAQQRQEIQIAFDYARLQQASATSQDSQIFSAAGQAQLDLNLAASETLPQRVSNYAARASHETAESILQKSLNRRHALDTLSTLEFLLVTVDEPSSAAAHYDAGISTIYNFLSSFAGFASSATSAAQLVAMIYADTDTLQAVARRIYPTLNLSADRPMQGFYNSADHLLMATVVNGNYGTLIHEMTHALLYANSPQLPEWFIEAVANLYQNSQLRADRLHPLYNTSNTSNNTLRPDAIADLNSLAEQIVSGNVSPHSSELQLFLVFLERNGKLQSLQTLLQYRDDSFRFDQLIADLGIREFQWQRFLQLTLTRANSVRYSEFQKNPTSVQYIQLTLSKILGRSLVVDGLWGPATEQALRDFQQSRELLTDGVPGPQTMQQLSAQYGLTVIDTP